MSKEHFDFTNNLLNVGDKVVYLYHSRTSSHLRKGVIERFTPCFVALTNGTKVAYNKVVRYHD